MRGRSRARARSRADYPDKVLQKMRYKTEGGFTFTSESTVKGFAKDGTLGKLSLKGDIFGLKLDKLQLTMEQALSMLSAQSKMLTTLLQGVDKLAPKLICFLPAVEYKKGWLGTLKSPKDWFNQRVRIFFIDPLTLTLAKTNDGNGFELDFPKDWVAR